MNNTLGKRLFIGLAAFFFIISSILIFGCAGTKVKAKYETKDNSGYTKTEHKHKHKKGGPPAHAKAHGYRAKHKYRYYPDCSVYHDTGRGLYFYIKGGNWEVGASLPHNLQMGLGESVSLELDTDKPYTYHAEHVKQYPPEKVKKGKKKKNKKHKWG
ncbi:MAG: hypothetical protein ACQ9MH_26715 [Nitrospinales bacterium]